MIPVQGYLATAPVGVFPRGQEVKNMSDPIQSLYIHVPFCAKKCDYCAFYSQASDGAVVDRYVSALIREMEMVAGELKLRTIFFGFSRRWNG